MAEKTVTVTAEMVQGFLLHMARSDVEIGLECWATDDSKPCFERADQLSLVANWVGSAGYPNSIEVEVSDE